MIFLSKYRAGSAQEVDGKREGGEGAQGGSKGSKGREGSRGGSSYAMPHLRGIPSLSMGPGEL